MSDPTPALLLLLLFALEAGMHLAKHGDPKTGMHSVWPMFFSLAVLLSLLAWGGFFASLGCQP